ncbi:MAG: hypothetical protein LBB58_03360 [Cellulomonadaceae bacterium]|nr:hypothetical protein [Cellulomonadaceae bacterium]
MANATQGATKKAFKGGKVQVLGTTQACKIVGTGLGTQCSGSTLTAKVTGLTPGAETGVTFTYQWYRGDKKIPDATAKTYKLTYPADANAKISVQAIAKKTGYNDAKLKSEPTAPAVAFSTKIVATTTDHESGQDSINACRGGLTHMKNVTNTLGQMYLPIENLCGGLPILMLQVGYLVLIEGLGTFRVVDSRDVNKGGTTQEVRGLKGTHILQTCYPSNSSKGNKMLVVGLEKAA